MNRLIPAIVAILVLADILTLGVLEQWRSRPAPPDLTARVAQLEKELGQAQQDIGEIKQELLLIQRRGQGAD